MRRRGLDGDADVRMLEIFRSKHPGQLVVELRRGEVRRLDLADQRKRDVSAKVDIIITRKVLHLEDFDR